MSEKIISKDKIQDLLKALMAKWTVIAPMDRGDAPAEFQELKTGDQPILAGDKMMMTPKDYLLPRYETLFTASTKPGEAKVETSMPDDSPRFMLGMWLPDAQAIQVLDRVFLERKFIDPYYEARRKNTVLVATVPAQPRWSWFCSSVDDVDTWKKNVDAVMYDLGDKYYVEITSDKGEEVFSGDTLSKPAEPDTTKKNDIWQNFKDSGKQSFAGKALYKNLEWGNPVWAEIAQKCIACGMCSYMCPSCSCFDIQDETCGDCVERYRCRDTCQFEDFTLMGHGHNPRNNQLPRSRQRLLHKFMYQHEQFGVVGCTGCGRCVELCPVNVDIRDALNRTCGEDRSEV